MKKQYFCTAVPVIPLPDIMLVMNPGFLFTLRRLRNRIFHQEAICWDLYYLTCLHDNLVTVLGWMNEDMPKWLAPIDPFDTVCEAIRNEMGWK